MENPGKVRHPMHGSNAGDLHGLGLRQLVPLPNGDEFARFAQEQHLPHALILGRREEHQDGFFLFYAAQVEFESIRIKRLEEYVNIVVEAGELATNPLHQQVTPIVTASVEKVVLVKPAVKKRAVVAKKVPAAKKVARKRVK